MATRKLKCEIGDVLALPLSDTEFAFARVINLKDGWDLAEVLSFTASTDSPDDVVLRSEALYPPITFHLREVERGNIKTVFRTPKYEAGYIDDLLFVTGSPGRHETLRANQYRPEAKVSDDVAATLPKLAFYAPPGTAKLVRQILADGISVSAWLAQRR